MTAVVRTARILRYAALGGIQDFFAMYTWSTWLFGWLSQVIIRVIFFTLIGRLIESEARLEFLLVGNAAFLCASTVMFVVQSTTWERSSGTIGLLIVSPANPLIVLLGRSVEWIPDAVLSSVAAFVVAGALFDLTVVWPSAVLVLPVLLLITMSAYFAGAFVGSFALRFVMARNLISNLFVGFLMVSTGVNVPMSYLPDAVRGAASVLPLTHGLQAVRLLLVGESSGVGRLVVLESLVMLGWFAVAALSFNWFLDGGRRSGTIDLDR